MKSVAMSNKMKKNCTANFSFSLLKCCFHVYLSIDVRVYITCKSSLKYTNSTLLANDFKKLFSMRQRHGIAIIGSHAKVTKRTSREGRDLISLLALPVARRRDPTLSKSTIKFANF